MKSIRTAWTIIFAAGLIFVLVGSASAATPAFEFDIRVDGSTVQVTVDFEPVPIGFAWSQLEASGVPDELVGVYPADQVDDRGRPFPDVVPQLLSLKRVEEGVYTDSLTLTDGRWAVVAWPLFPDFDPDTSVGAARTEFVTVGGPPTWVWPAFGAIAAMAVARLAIGSKTRRRPVKEESI